MRSVMRCDGCGDVIGPPSQPFQECQEEHSSKANPKLGSINFSQTHVDQAFIQRDIWGNSNSTATCINVDTRGQ